MDDEPRPPAGSEEYVSGQTLPDPEMDPENDEEDTPDDDDDCPLLGVK